MLFKTNNLTEGKRNHKQADPEVKTFPVPFAFTEKQENISISTNTPSNPSKEEIINQAIQFHSQGNIQKQQNIINFLLIKGLKITEFFLIMEQFYKV